jgi:thymidylate kinase
MAKIERLLVTFSGVDGSGKTTLSKTLIKRLAHENINAEYLWWFSAENSFFGQKIRTIVNKLVSPPGNNNAAISTIGRAQVVYQFLVLADYLLHVWFSLAVGKNIVCDRYVYDIAAFFVTELQYSEAKAKKLIKLLRNVAPQPRVAFLVDISAEIAMQRKKDIRSIEQHEKLRRLYFDLIKGDHKITVLDGSKELDELTSIAWTQVHNRLENKS